MWSTLRPIVTVRKRGWTVSLGLAASLAGLLALAPGCPTKQNPAINGLCCHDGICSLPDGGEQLVDGSPGACTVPDAEAPGDALEPDAADASAD
jgi:hypothetical protein